MSTLENDLYREVERVVRDLFAAKIPGTDEPDLSRAAVGAFLAWLFYDMPDDFVGFARRVLPRDIAHRASEAEATARRRPGRRRKPRTTPSRADSELVEP
jgi:hypothetical protein